MNDMAIKPEDALKAAIGKHLQECQMANGIAGDLLVFRKGIFERGPDKTPVPEGTRFRPNPWEFWHGWQKFQDGHIAGLVLCRVTEGKPPLRDTLGDLDESLWKDGRDPWQPNWRFIMQDMAGALLTFSTQSSGGQRAYEDLLNAYFTDKHHENQWPVVTVGTAHLTAGSMAGSRSRPSPSLIGQNRGPSRAAACSPYPHRPTATVATVPQRSRPRRL
jgi:hypothetical protein